MFNNNTVSPIPQTATQNPADTPVSFLPLRRMQHQPIFNFLCRRASCDTQPPSPGSSCRLLLLLSRCYTTTTSLSPSPPLSCKDIPSRYSVA